MFPRQFNIFNNNNANDEEGYNDLCVITFFASLLLFVLFEAFIGSYDDDYNYFYSRTAKKEVKEIKYLIVENNLNTPINEIKVFLPSYGNGYLTMSGSLSHSYLKENYSGQTVFTYSMRAIKVDIRKCYHLFNELKKQKILFALKNYENFNFKAQPLDYCYSLYENGQIDFSLTRF